MNVKIVNKYAALLAGLDIDFIKSIEGEFTPEDIVMQFSNFFFKFIMINGIILLLLKELVFDGKITESYCC